MKLHLENPASRNLITGHGAGYVAINHRRHETSLIVLPGRIVESWGMAGFDALVEEDFAAIRDLVPEIVLFGTGARQRFPAPQLLRPLIEARIGCEVMDLPAACRTFNILVAEGRLVAAALLIDPIES
ncbi:MAG: Mth938-like domain-containing protein [Betaproteobacteria bacterium]|jgi:uncharacterized protein|nr:Mth938-like domain-containing protein [Betaproteobacteria bacterium]